MDGKAIKLIQYLDGSDKRFIIPVYQRNYSWKVDNCRQLYDDLVKMSITGRTTHFFGSLVSVYNGRYEEYLIIDGQQRVTTISLLLLAMHNLLKEGKLEAEDNRLIDKVYNKYLIDEYDPSVRRIKLKAVSKDRSAFERLFEDEPADYIPNSDITINYLYFYERIRKEEISIDALYDAISRLVVINITVDEDDNPQLIFESLNSTGVDLTEGDKIRNYVLMGQSPENQESFYTKYWSKIESFTGGDYNRNGVSLFVRDYLSVKRQSTPSMDKIYAVFKSYFDEQGISIEEMLKDMLEYARLYRMLTESKFNDDVVNASIFRLNYLETTVSRPFFLQVLSLNSQGILCISDVREIFSIVENYLFRRNICEVPTNALNKVFLTLNREILRYDGTYDNFVEKMKFALTSKKESGRFPDDQEFSIALSEKQVYLMRSRYKNYLFERYENFGTDEVKKYLYANIEDGKYSIEHIMPQTLTPVWRTALGEDSNEIHATWLHRLANLTLTAYNSSYSNNPFLVKRDNENGFKNSGFRMNQLIAQKDQWTLSELEERDAYMVSRALIIWSYPSTEYRPTEKQLDSVTLDEDVTLTGSQIAKFSYKESEQVVDSWVDMYTKVLQLLHTEDSSILTELAYTSDTSIDLSIHVSCNPEAFHSKVQIAPNIFIWTGTSTQHKLSTLRKFFKLYRADPADLVFYLKDRSGATPADDAPERNEVRKKYWTFALPYIQEKFGVGETFSNVNPTTSNWISGFFGIGGFNVTCTANYDCARVQLYLGKTSKEKNKAAFDHLFRHKTEIEAKLGIQLRWERADNNKASYVSCELNGVSVVNETDWIRMAKFHAEWSKKLCDAMLPLLRELYP